MTYLKEDSEPSALQAAMLLGELWGLLVSYTAS